MRTFVRPSRERPPTARRKLELRRGVGIVDDCHDAELSPRQVLLTASGAYERLKLDANSLRENILIDAERLDWTSGSAVRIGRSVVLRVMFVCEPCAKLNAHRSGLVREVGRDRGLLARVVRGGAVHVGDIVQVTAGVYEAFPDEWQERLCAILERLPIGACVSYVKLAELIGVRTSYCRVFPRVLRHAGAGANDGTGATSGVRRDHHGGLTVVGSADLPRAGVWRGVELFAGE